MNQTEVENIILGHLYEANFNGEVSYNVPKAREETNWDEAAFRKVVSRMTDQGLIKGFTMGGNYRITTLGILHAEENGLASDELRQENQQLRSDTLDALAKIYDESTSVSNEL